MSYDVKNERASRYAKQKAAVAAKVKGQVAEYEVRAERLAADVEALERLQAARPMKPPGRPVGRL